MDFDTNERGTPHYFLFGLQRSATNLVQTLIKRNFGKEHCVTAEWNKHDVTTPQPASGVATYDEIIKWYKYPAIFTYKPIVPWINSILNDNDITDYFRHAEYFMRYVVEVDELLDKDSPEKYAISRCRSFYSDGGEVKCHTTMANGFQWQHKDGLQKRQFMHKKTEYAIPLDRYISYWHKYYIMWSNVIKELKKANHKIYIVNSMDLLTMENQAKFIKDIYTKKILNTAVELDTSSIKVVGENETIAETNDFAKKKEEYKQEIWRNLTDEQVKYIKRKTPKTIARLYEKW